MATAERIKVTSYSRDKGILRFTTNRNKNYEFDINKVRWIGLTGKELVKMPPVVAEYVHQQCWNNNTATSILMLLNTYCGAYTQHYDKRLVLLFDRFTSLGLKVKPRVVPVNTIEENFKEFVKWAKENSENNTGFIYADGFEKYLIKVQWAEKVAKMCSPNISPALLDFLTRFAYDYRKTYETEHNLKCVCYWVERTLGYRWQIVTGSYSRDTFATNNNLAVSYDTYRITTELCEFFKLAKYLGYTPDKSDFEKQFIAVKKDYWVKKLYTDNQIVTNLYNKYADNLLYENNQFKVILLDTVEKLCAESHYQQNCIAHNYIPAILDGRCLIVGIRAKDDVETPLVSCEVKLNGQINQYLRKHNAWVDQFSHPELYAFKKEYQSYLATKKWGK